MKIQILFTFCETFEFHKFPKCMKQNRMKAYDMSIRTVNI